MGGLDDFNHAVEGWALDIASGTFHYFAGMSGLGGRFRSLCHGPTIPCDAKLWQGGELTAPTIRPRCDTCAAKLGAANQESTPPYARNRLH